MSTLPVDKRAQMVSFLVEGNGANAITRITGVAKNTVLKLFRDLGEACEAYHDEHVRGLTSKCVQADEIWSFCYAKRKNVPAERQGEFGYRDVRTWTAIDADSKLIVSWHIGWRGANDALIFMHDVAERLANRVQLTADGHQVYLNAVDEGFDRGVDYAMRVKLYGEDLQDAHEHRYRLAHCVGSTREVVRGCPDSAHISASFAEKHNQTMRQNMKRFTRLTAGHSKKLDNHRAAVALHFVHYNFARIRHANRCTPAMEAGISDHVWDVREIVKLAN